MRPINVTPARVAVIGAGAAGLAAARELQDVGIAVDVYEAASRAGGLWTGPGPAYASLRANTSKQISAFSTSPFQDNTPDFPALAEIGAYLQAYARPVEHLIRYNARVDLIAPAGEGWDIAAGDMQKRYGAVVVATGIFRHPFCPPIPGLESFRGQMRHSLDYHDAEPFREQSVLVVGIGSSAGDIAVDLAGAGADVALSTRHGARVAPRFVQGRPLDHRNTRLSLLLPQGVRAWRRQRLLRSAYAAQGWESLETVWSRAGVPFHPHTAPSVTNDALLPLVAANRIRVRPGIERVDGGQVRFVDGSAMRADAIILGTGYLPSYSFVPPGLAEALYGLVFPPEAPTLAFAGLLRAQGPIFPLVEMQARWIAQVFSGRARLPDAAGMRAAMGRHHVPYGTPPRVQLLGYLDEIGGMIGVRPALHRHLQLTAPLLTGPPVAAQYRLDGPGRWDGAESVIRRAARYPNGRE